MITTGTIVGGRYRVVRRIGGGGMKQVYLAEDTRLANRSCALAEMIDSLADPAERQAAAASFQREADMLAGLEHENIVRIYDRLSDGSRHFLVMEYVEGETLERKLESTSDKKLDEKSVAEAALQVLGALEYLHGQNPPVVYRDLKPANVMVRANGRIKLIDFGIARLFIPKKTATMVGTQGYAPPEQYEGKAEPRSDLYALGVTMFHLLTGWDPALHPPFMFPQIQSLRPDLNPALAALVGEAMALDANRRIASAAEFRRRLENLAGEAARPSLRIPRAVVQPPMAPDAPTVKGLGAFACPSCAKPVPADAKFCPYCSADLSAAPEAPKPHHRPLRPMWLAGSLAVFLAVGFAATYYYVQTQQEAVTRVRPAEVEEVHKLYGQYVQCYRQDKDEVCKSAVLASAVPDRIQQTAASGDAQAQVLLAAMFDTGTGVPKDYGEALKWWRKAVEQGSAYAQLGLGGMYYDGQGVSKDYSEAVRWFRKAAEQDNAYAEGNLGVMYDNGIGVPKDYAEAVKWYRKAAEQGNAYAEGNLGVMYERGRGDLPQDYGEALKWYRKAAEHGDAHAEGNLGIMYDNGHGVPKDHGEAVRWFRKAAEQGDADGQSYLGVMYRDGHGVPQDYSEALKWFRKAAKQGKATAELGLGGMYYDGQGAPKNYSEALKWYREAGEQGDAGAEGNLGAMYRDGEGAPKDYREAVRWFRKAAEQGNADAEGNLGVMYATGHGVPKDYGEAVRWFRKAAEQGDAHAEGNLGVSYYYGQGVPQENDEAIRWLNKAAADGDQEAKRDLEKLYGAR